MHVSQFAYDKEAGPSHFSIILHSVELVNSFKLTCYYIRGVS
jgi:hypothetical protein